MFLLFCACVNKVKVNVKWAVECPVADSLVDYLKKFQLWTFGLDYLLFRIWTRVPPQKAMWSDRHLSTVLPASRTLGESTEHAFQNDSEETASIVLHIASADLAINATFDRRDIYWTFQYLNRNAAPCEQILPDQGNTGPVYNLATTFVHLESLNFYLPEQHFDSLPSQIGVIFGTNFLLVSVNQTKYRSTSFKSYKQ